MKGSLLIYVSKKISNVFWIRNSEIIANWLLMHLVIFTNNGSYLYKMVLQLKSSRHTKANVRFMFDVNQKTFLQMIWVYLKRRCCCHFLSTFLKSYYCFPVLRKRVLKLFTFLKKVAKNIFLINLAFSFLSRCLEVSVLMLQKWRRWEKQKKLQIKTPHLIEFLWSTLFVRLCQHKKTRFLKTVKLVDCNLDILQTFLMWQILCLNNNLTKHVLCDL